MAGVRTKARCPSPKERQERDLRGAGAGLSLIGPLRVPGWRGSDRQRLERERRPSCGAKSRQSSRPPDSSARFASGARPIPGKIETATGTLEVLSSDRTAGHSSSFDLVIVDETGFMPERARELLAGLRSSVSAKGGRIVHISVRGDSPLFAEVLANPATVAHQFSAPDACTIDDRDPPGPRRTPGSARSSSVGYMAAEVNANPERRARRRAELSRLRPESAAQPDAGNDSVAGRSPGLLHGRSAAARGAVPSWASTFGEATSSTAACAIWPATGRLETWMAFGDVPPLAERGKRDSAPYAQMEARGELRTYPGRIVPPAAFLADLQNDLRGCRVRAAAADSLQGQRGPRLPGPRGGALAYRLPPRRRRQGRRPRRAGPPAACASAQARAGREPVAYDRDIEVDPPPGRERQPGARQSKRAGAYRCLVRGRHRGGAGGAGV